MTAKLTLHSIASDIEIDADDFRIETGAVVLTKGGGRVALVPLDGVIAIRLDEPAKRTPIKTHRA